MMKLTIKISLNDSDYLLSYMIFIIYNRPEMTGIFHGGKYWVDLKSEEIQ